jgi:TolB-like protein/Tfp pilus assembly protein PilF
VSSFFTELKRRNVFRVGIAYIVVAWLLAQVADLAFENFGTPDWAIKTLLFVLVLGFPLAVFFAWAFEMTPEGIKKEKDVDRSQSITAQTGRKLDFIIIGILVAALGYFVVDKFVFSPGAEQAITSTAKQAEDTLAEKSIAVLPFVNMSSDPEQEYFSDGISEEILNALAKIGELKVAGRTSSFSFKGKNEDLRLIGEALSVAHILEGSVRKSGNQIRVTAQLIKVDDGYHMWSETYDRELDDIFAIQDEISTAILEQMKLHLIGGEEPVRLASTRGDVEAYNLYLAAKQNIYTRDKTSLELASDLLEQAIEIDPAYAPAYAQRGIALLLLSDNNYGEIPEDEAYELTRPLFDKALELDPELAEAHAGLGLWYQDNGNQFQESIESLERALTINPGSINALNWLQTALAFTGELARSGEISEQILERDPLYKPAINNVGFYYVRSGQQEKLKALIDRVNLYLPGIPAIQLLEINYERASGNIAQATRLAEAFWEQEKASGGLTGAAGFQYAISLRTTAQWEKMLELGEDGFEVLALRRLGRGEEAKMLANKRALEEENFGPLIGIFIVDREFQRVIDLFEARWANLDEYERENPQRTGFGSGDFLDLAFAYREIGRMDKFEEVLSRAREAHEQQRAEGANNGFFWFSLSLQSLLEDNEEQAITYLERGSEFGFNMRRRIVERWPMLAALNGNPRYETLLGNMLAHINSERAKLELEPLEPEPYL